MKKIKNYFIDRFYNRHIQPHIDKYGIEEVKQRLYDGIYPHGYESAKYRIKQALNGYKAPVSTFRDDIWAEYLQIPKNKRHIIFGKDLVYDAIFTPTVSKNNTKYKRLFLADYEKKKIIDEYYKKDRTKSKDKLSYILGIYFNEHTLDSGFDKKGQYVSYYDKWDISPSDAILNINKGNREDESKGLGTPIEFYDRIYLDDVYNIPEEAKGNPWIAPAVVTAKVKKEMGGIQKQNKLQIKNGIAQPLGKGYYLMNGPSHEQGGIDIGKNLEVEGGEIVKLNPKSIKVLSNAKIMGDITPAEYALGGLKDGTFEDRYNKGFKYQEKFKDINNLKDDGTKAEMGIFKKIKNWIFGDKESTENQDVVQYRRVLPSDIESTKKRTESFENHIVNNINARLRTNPRGIEYNIPYVYDKEIKVDGVGRLSTNMLDSLAVNLPIANETLRKAGKPELTFRDAVGLAGEETNFGASPNVSLDAWIKKYRQDNNGKEPSAEEKHEYERALLNMSVARNFGGIPAPYLINNQSSYYSQGWKNSIHGKYLNSVESPLANGLIQYGLGIYNTNAKYHTTSVKNKGNTILNDKDVKKWLNENKEKYNLKLGGQMKKKYKIGGNVNVPSTGKKIKADLGLQETLNKFGQHFLYPKVEPAVVTANVSNSKTKNYKSFGDQLHMYTNMVELPGYMHTLDKLDYTYPYWNYAVNEKINLNKGNVPIPYRLEEEVVQPKIKNESFSNQNQNNNVTTNKVQMQERTNSTATNNSTPATTKNATTPIQTNAKSFTPTTTNNFKGLNLDFLNEIINPNGSTYNLRTGQTYFKDWNKVRRTPYSSLNLKTGKTEYAGFINPYGSKIQSAVYNNGPQGRQERTTKERLLNTGDWINIGINSAGALTNLITGLVTPNIRYARMRDSIPVMAPKVNSNVNTTAEESAIDEAFNDEMRAINENTASSKTALNRKRNAALRKRQAKVKVRSAAENTRRDLINKGNILKGEYDKFNIQRQEQVDAYNRQAKADEFNANRTKVGDAIIGFVSDLSQGASTITNTLERREADRVNTVLSYMGNPEVNPNEFGKGFDEIYEKLYGRKPSRYIRKKYNKK